MIGKVKEFGAELEMSSLGDIEHFKDREIPDLETRSKYRIASRIAK